MGWRSVIDLLGPYVEAPPRDVALPVGGGPARGTTRPHDLRLETGVVSRSRLVRRRRSCTGACSVVLHSVGLTAAIEVPTELTPEKGLDLGIEGGVAGGVVGAIVGGLPEAAPPPPPALEPIRVGTGVVHEPKKIRHVAPVYPAVAVAARVEASVTLEASIDERGRVVGVTVLQGSPLFDKAALEAVRQWAYTPTLLDGVPVPIIMAITVHFELMPG